MRTRALDSTGDWTFGKGVNNYKKDINALIQDIDTRLKSFLGDCFFDMAGGIDWFNLNSQKDISELKRAISSVLMNTNGVTGLTELSVSLGQNRVFTIQYSLDSIFGVIATQVTQEV